MRDALIAPLREIYGVSDKVLTMALSSLLLGAPKRMRLWHEVGASMIAIDTLVHNFLHRTGILHRFDAAHAYGSACYRPGGCADIIQAVAERIDARAFNPAFPMVFPRFVQHAIWRYCAQSGLASRRATVCSVNVAANWAPAASAAGAESGMTANVRRRSSAEYGAGADGAWAMRYAAQVATPSTTSAAMIPSIHGVAARAASRRGFIEGAGWRGGSLMRSSSSCAVKR